MPVYLAPGAFGAGYQAFDSNGIPLNGGFINTYAAGTTTSQATFTTVAGTVTNANPIQLSTDGRPQNSGNLVEIWLTSGIAYKFQIVDSLSNQIAVYDNLTGINDIGAQSEWIAGATPTFVSATQFTVAGNQAVVLDVGRRIKAVVTAGTIYGTVSAVSFSTNTTVTVDWDSTQLDAGLSAFSYALLDASGPSVPSTRFDQPAETITAAATLDLGTIRARSINIIGSTAITRLSIPDGQVRFLQFSNQVTLSNTVSQILSVTSGATITANTGDATVFRGEPGLARMLSFARKDGQPLTSPTSATQAQQEAGTITSAPVTPAVQQFHPSALKAWVHGNMAAGINASYNVASITDVGVGVATPVFVTAFSTSNYSAIACPYVASDTFGIIFNSLGGRTTTACATAYVSSTTHTTADPIEFHFMAAGDQP